MRLGAAPAPGARLERVAQGLTDLEIEVLAYEIEAFMKRRALRERRAQLAGTLSGGERNRVRHDPAGVVAVSTPWNAPFMLATWRVGPALGAGNTVVLKPSEQTPLTTLKLAGLLAELLAAQRATAFPSQIALLLPLSSPQRAFALAIRDGFMAAHLRNQSATPTSVRVYDTARLGSAEAYLQAQLDGAAVVGLVPARAVAQQPLVDVTQGELAERLVVAMEAAQAAGGDKRGMQSAAMLIVKKGGGVWLNNDVVLRLQVDDSTEPIKEMRRLVEMSPDGRGRGRGAGNW